MVLCEIAEEYAGNFWITWGILTVIGFSLIMGMSAVLFVLYYVKPTYATWVKKSNPQYPSPIMVRC